MRQNSSKTAILLFGCTLFISLFVFSLLSVVGEARPGINLSLIDQAGDPVGGAKIFLDKAYVGRTNNKGVKKIKNVAPGSHLVVAKKTDLGRTSANLYMSEAVNLQLKLKILANKSSPSPAQFGFFPKKPRAGKKVKLKGFSPMGMDSSRLNYEWDLGSDGNIDRKGVEVTTTFPSSGMYPVTLIVTKNGEVEGRQTRELAVKPMNLPPKASFSTKTPGLTVGKPISFDASGSKDRNDEITEYRWQFDGSSDKTGKVVKHTFTEPGPHEVRLVVSDKYGETAEVTKQLNVAPKTYVSRLFFKEGEGMNWVTANKLSRNEPMKLTNSDKGRELALFFEREQKEVKEVVQQIKPTSAGVIDVIGQVVVKPSENVVELQGKGYAQIGEITYDLDRDLRKREIKDWNGNTKFQKKREIAPMEGMDQTQHSFTINFVTRESLESIALDILADENNEPLIVATTELFNYRKLSAVKTSLQSGVKPSKYNLSPHLMAYAPGVIYATERVKFDFVSFDPDGRLGKMVVDWGDGNKKEIEEPISGKNKVYHTYEDPGKYDVTVTSYDRSGRENNFKKVSFTVTVKERAKIEPEPEPKKQKDPHCPPFYGYIIM